MVDVGVSRAGKTRHGNEVDSFVDECVPRQGRDMYSRTVGNTNKCSRANDAVGFFFVCVVAVCKPAQHVPLRHGTFLMRRADCEQLIVSRA